MPVRFIHGGQAIVGGTLNGRMSIWDIHTRRKQYLTFDGPSCIRAVSACYITSSDTLLIATGNSERGCPPSVVVWKAQEVYHSSSISASSNKHAGKDKLVRMLQWFTYCFAAMLVLMYLVELYEARAEQLTLVLVDVDEGHQSLM
ncbi:hypothetical protein EVJ58_g7575 [Rhodofomes roseus]|uniref:Uncharacterized protein n=1 Tax=Rhodofomes roseus TaxID=34475 RepID=A0A4Y9Y4P0_9APHY|nr:hypothetical protein EVJ58_g7575 [Rhodofomes roseus]